MMHTMQLRGLPVVRGCFLCVGLLAIGGEEVREKHRGRRMAALVTSDGRVFPITKSVVRIGRTDPSIGAFPEIDLASEDSGRYVSRRHARIIQRGKRWLLIGEPGAKHGTYLNQRKLSPGEGVPLKDGDTLRLATVRAVFRSKGQLTI